jgi:hypothetical protein
MTAEKAKHLVDWTYSRAMKPNEPLNNIHIVALRYKVE